MNEKTKPLTFVPNPKRVPSPEAKQQETIRPGSRLAVVGVFVEIVRKRFTMEGMPWLWNADLSDPKGKIAIDSAFSEDTDHRNFRPAIYIDCDNQTRGRSVIGDRAVESITTGQTLFWGLDTVPILIECVAAKKGESAVIGDITSIFLHASSDLIQAKFGFHEMTPVETGRTQPFGNDKDEWVTPVTFSVQCPSRWSNKQTAPLLQQIAVSVAASNFDNATDYFEQIALGTWHQK